MSVVFLLSTRSIGHGLFHANNLMAFRALAGAVTSAIHFVPWPKPTHAGQFWLFHASVSHRLGRFGYPMNIQTDDQLEPIVACVGTSESGD